MPASLYEDNLIQKCCDGDRTAYRDLYDLFSAELMAIALRYMKTNHEAEDVLQDSFLKVFKNLASFDQRSGLKTWITRIVINTALNKLRKEHNKYDWDISEAHNVHADFLPLQEFHFKELIALIQQLPTGCRAVFNLYAIEGYSHKEVAEMLEISQGTSKSQYHRAKGLLQKIIASENIRTNRRAL